jgi:amino acid transporter
VVCTVLAILIILCFAEVSSRFATTGGPYLYAHRAFGPFVGFEIGFLLWLARFTAFAALCNLWLDYLSFVWEPANTGAWRTILICGIVAVLTWLNIRGVRGSSIFNNVFTVGKLIPLVLFATVGLFFINPGNFTFGEFPKFSVFSSAVLPLVFAFTGFEMAVIPAGESSDPRKHAPFALITGAIIVATLYMLIQIVSIGTLPGLADSTRPLADAGAAMFGTAGGVFIVVGALISITGTLNTIVLVGPRLIFAMAEQRQLPRIFAATHSRFHTPYVSIIASSVLMLVLTLQGSFITSLAISTVIRLITYASVCVALPVLRRRGDAPAAQFTAPAGYVVAGGALALCAWLVSSSAQREVQLTAIAIAAGIFFYLIFNLRRAAA